MGKDEPNIVETRKNARRCAEVPRNGKERNAPATRTVDLLKCGKARAQMGPWHQLEAFRDDLIGRNHSDALIQGGNDADQKGCKT